MGPLGERATRRSLMGRIAPSSSDLASDHAGGRRPLINSATPPYATVLGLGKGSLPRASAYSLSPGLSRLPTSVARSAAADAA
jgi:hypothetical protein